MRRLMTSTTAVRMFIFSFIFAYTLPAAYAQQDLSMDDLRKAWGFDILISDGGFGAGGFYWREFTPTIAGFISLSVSESKDKREVEFFNPWTGQKFVPGKINRFYVIPLQVGVQYRLFKDQIMDNFRPFVSVGLGPSMIYTTPYERSFFNAFGYGKAFHTVGGYIGAGAYIGSDPSNLTGINFRYYFVPYTGGIDSMDASLYEPGGDLGERNYLQKKQFGGFFITFSFGMAR
jgi:hypothetical protein